MPPVKASNLPFTLNIIDNGNNILDFATELANATTPRAVANVCARHTHGWPFEVRCVGGFMLIYPYFTLIHPSNPPPNLPHSPWLTSLTGLLPSTAWMLLWIL